jgi:hypothetical protein
LTDVTQVIKGWTEAMQMMVEGDKWEMWVAKFHITFLTDPRTSVIIMMHVEARDITLRRYMPSELGYGDSGSPPLIKGGDALVFQMELIKIKVRSSSRESKLHRLNRRDHRHSQQQHR